MLHKYKKFLEADSQGNGMLDYLMASRNTNNLSNDGNMKRILKTLGDATYSADRAKTGFGGLYNALGEILGKKSGYEGMNSSREMGYRLGKDTDINDPKTIKKIKNLEDGQKRRNKAEQDAMFERIPSAIVGPPSYEIKASKAGRDARNAVEARASKAASDAKAAKEAKDIADAKRLNDIRDAKAAYNNKSASEARAASEARTLSDINKPKYNPKFSLNKDNLPKVKSVQPKDNSYKVPDLRTSPKDRLKDDNKYLPKFSLNKDNVPKSVNSITKDNSYKVPDLRTSPKNQNNTTPIVNKPQDSPNPLTDIFNGAKNKMNDLSKEVQGKVNSKVDDVKSDINIVKSGLNDSLNKANKEIKDALTRTPPHVTQASKNAMANKEAQDAKAKQSYIYNKARVEKENAFKERLSSYQSSPQRFVDDAKRNPGKTAAVTVAGLGVATYAAYKMAQQKKWRDKGCSTLSGSEKVKCQEYLKSKKG